MSIKVGFQEGSHIADAVKKIDYIPDGTFIFAEDTERLYIKMKGKILGITPKHRSIVELRCNNCGATLSNKSDFGSIVQCEFCGSVYDVDSWNTDVE